MRWVAAAALVVAMISGTITLGVTRASKERESILEARLRVIEEKTGITRAGGASLGRIGGGFPLPLKPPPNLSGVRRLRWNAHGLELWGPSKEKCAEWGGRFAGGTCRLSSGGIVNRPVLNRDSAPASAEWEVPTLRGVGVLLDRLRRRPFVLTEADWENGRLSVTGHLAPGGD
ncbi:MAG: hypothetical protein HYT87_20335 [Nitrospirae bacterium]|nr:hypothetical protein [Nitrospirota bacterium]